MAGRKLPWEEGGLVGMAGKKLPWEEGGLRVWQAGSCHGRKED